MLRLPMLRLPVLLIAPLALALTACATPSHVSGRAPDYADGYQPVMGGYATSWPDQPGALWGPEDVPDIDVFYEPLGAHGRWVDSRWGRAFVPAAPAGWRPYQNGRWLENRFWLSADPWGWATDHYGRWGYDEQIGWLWVPGTTWGPSWVAWREADEVVGWAPIPPQVQWNVGLGFGSGWGYDNWNSWYGPSWLWVPRASLFSIGFGNRLLPWSYGASWWGRSRWQHSPYWGWNSGWDRGWGWQAPAWAWNGWAGRYPGWSNWGWNRPSWYRPGWNGHGNRPGWNGNWNRGPQRGAPGSVGDRIGRDLAGQPAVPPAGWQGDRRRDGSGLSQQQWNNRGDGWRDGLRGDGRRDADRGEGWRGNRDTADQGNGGRPDGRPGGWRAPPAGSLGTAVGGAMPRTPPPPVAQAAPQSPPVLRPPAMASPPPAATWRAPPQPRDGNRGGGWNGDGGRRGDGERRGDWANRRRE